MFKKLFQTFCLLILCHASGYSVDGGGGSWYRYHFSNAIEFQNDTENHVKIKSTGYKECLGEHYQDPDAKWRWDWESSIINPYDSVTLPLTIGYSKSPDHGVDIYVVNDSKNHRGEELVHLLIGKTRWRSGGAHDYEQRMDVIKKYDQKITKVKIAPYNNHTFIPIRDTQGKNDDDRLWDIYISDH